MLHLAVKMHSHVIVWRPLFWTNNCSHIFLCTDLQKDMNNFTLY